jgi:hypothetical protein
MALLTTLGLRRPNIWERPTVLDHLLTSPLRWLAALLYRLLLALRGRPFRAPRRDPIRVVCLSDTHDQAPAAVPPGDLLIHCGDLTNPGTAADIQRQVDWLVRLPHRHKVLVAGNHDSWFDPAARKVICARGLEEEGAVVDLKGLTYLENTAVTLEFDGGRQLNLFGGPALPACGGDDFA